MPAWWQLSLLSFALAAGSLLGQSEPDRWTLRGRVVAAETGQALAGCKVRITGHQATGHPLHWSWMDWEDPAPLTTGADGRFEVTFRAQPGRGIADGYPSRVHVVVDADTRVQHFGQVFLSRFFASPLQDVGDIALNAGSTRDVIVVDTEGTPQECVVVRLRHDDALVFAERPPGLPRPWCWPRALVEFGSDAAGRLMADTPLAFGRHRIDVRNRKLAGEAVLDVTRDGTGPLRIVVEAAPSIAANGRIVDDRGKPVAALGLVAQWGGGDRRTTVRTTTGADGSYTFVTTAPTGTTFQLCIARDQSWPPIPVCKCSWRTDSGTVKLLSFVTVRLRPMLPAGHDAKRLAVHLVPAGTNDGPGSAAVRVVVPLVDGVATVERVPRGEYELRVHAAGTGLWPTDWMRFAARDADEPIDVDLVPLAEQPVIVFTTEGRPCDGVTLELVVPYVDPKGKEAPVWEPSYRFPMSSATPSWCKVGRLSAAVRTDRSGRATLRAIACNGPVAARVRGLFVAPTDVQWNGFAGDGKPVELRVPGAGAVVLELGDAALRVARDAAAPEERARAVEHGPLFDPWERSLGNLLQQTATGLVLRPTAQGTEHFVPCADVASVRVDSVPPGAYDVCLLVRGRENSKVMADVVEPPLARVLVKAGEVTTATVTLQDRHRARLR